jgi:hypothetical protein
MTLSEQVALLEKRKDEYQTLASLLLATIIVEKNAYLFKDFPQEWHDMINAWAEDYKRLQQEEKQDIG